MKTLRRLLITMLGIGLADGHGRLMEPPARNSMWRFGFVNPVNYNDNELFCGGMDKQFNENDGRCGICGDSASDPSPQTHETGGEFGNRIISKTYVTGSVIGLEIDITANHKGSFQLKLCPLGPRDTEATQACLDAHPLTQVDGAEEFPITEEPHTVTLTRTARLPPGLTCARCVLQWTWRSANSWGNCRNGTAGLGCGPQETFRNCADIRIVRSSAQLPATDNPRAIMRRDPNSKSGLSPLVVRSQVCVATEAWSIYQGMSDWCQLNCLRYPPNCPSDMCTCLTSCRASPASPELTDFSCSRSCLRYPHTQECPRGCQCEASDPGEAGLAGAGDVIIDVRSQEAGALRPGYIRLLPPVHPIQWSVLPRLIHHNFLF